ncbi:MAG TPA: TRAP transporter small permease subunit [Burkholderiales bacterium]|nr:TRAP transporter small permease subunit [Burkholderiales bacterium]
MSEARADAADMSLVFRLETRIIRWTRTIAVVSFVGLLAVSVMTMLDVLLRWVANAPIKGLNDINGLAVAIVIASCLPLVVAERQNISIRFLGEAAGAGAARWLDALGSGALLAFVALIGWQLVAHTAGLAESGRTTWHLRIPVTPYWSFATGVVLLCIPAQAIAFVADVMRAVTGAPAAREGDPEITDGASRS